MCGDSNSRNHIMWAGGLGAFLYEIGGLAPSLAWGLGVDRRPLFHVELDVARLLLAANVSVATLAGRFRVNWQLSSCSFMATVSVPHNSRADIQLPFACGRGEHHMLLYSNAQDENELAVWTGKAGSAKQPAAISSIMSDHYGLRMTLASGDHTFELRPQLPATDIREKTDDENPVIDRQALVRRHNPHNSEISDGNATTLTVGTGELGFNVDLTGLQTFNDTNPYLNTLSDFGWHTFPLESGTSEWPWSDLIWQEWPTSDPDRPRVRYPGSNCSLPPPQSAGQPICNFLSENPHRWNLGQLAFRYSNGSAPLLSNVRYANQTLDQFTGIVHSTFTLSDITFVVQTSTAGLVNGLDGGGNDVNAVAISVQTNEARTTGVPILGVQLAFPAPTTCAGGTVRNPAAPGGFASACGGGNWSRDADQLHNTTILRQSQSMLSVRRSAHFDSYGVACLGTNVTFARTGTHAIFMQPTASSYDIVCRFDDKAVASASIPTAAAARVLTSLSWRRFWNLGAAVDLSAVVVGLETRKPQCIADDGKSWCNATVTAELERRVVQSRYLLRAMEAGRLPPQETGLVTTSCELLSLYARCSLVHCLILLHVPHNVLHIVRVWQIPFGNAFLAPRTLALVEPV